MRILAVYGNPKSGGFVHNCVDAVAQRLESRGAEVDRLHLAEIEMKDCTGCFTCLRTGRCTIDDDMAGVIERIRAADGLVCGVSVRNGLMTALFKRFYERITYTIIFCGDITDKYVLGISAVGMAGGKAVTRRIVAMSEMGARTVDHLFFRTGIPTRISAEDASERL
ncbi:MAG: flavodoxin family protein, partial [Planctomycetes bacterium]|nr:flavodoxin family protein [Planctomycetota bacterium]